MGPGESLSSTTTIEYNNQIVDRVEHVCSVCVSVDGVSRACTERGYHSERGGGPILNTGEGIVNSAGGLARSES